MVAVVGIVLVGMTLALMHIIETTNPISINYVVAMVLAITFTLTVV